MRPAEAAPAAEQAGEPGSCPGCNSWPFCCHRLGSFIALYSRHPLRNMIKNIYLLFKKCFETYRLKILPS